MSKRRIQVLLGELLLLAAAMAHAEIALVVGASSSVTALSKQQAADIFMGKATSFPSGGEIKLLDQPESSLLREEFYSKVTGKSAAQAKAYWAKLSFTGRGKPPREGQNSSDIKHQVASDSKLIGYIEKSAVDSSVKVIYTAE